MIGKRREYDVVARREDEIRKGRREEKKGTERRERERERERRSDDEECEVEAFGITHHMQVRVSIVLYITWVVHTR
jgi:hypothetical protein